MRIRLDEVHYEMARRYEVDTGASSLLPGGYSFDESITAYYENDVHGYRLMVTRDMRGRMSFASWRGELLGGAESYSNLAESRDSESYLGFKALVRRMNRYRQEALQAFAHPEQAKVKISLEDVVTAMHNFLEQG